MERAKPVIHCRDTWWPGRLTQRKAEAYRRGEEMGLIANVRIRASENTGLVMVEYDSAIPREWVQEAMKC